MRSVHPLILPGCLLVALAPAFEASAQPTADAAPAAPGWPTFRGDSQFRGVAAGRLPDRLGLAWRFRTKDAIKSSAVIGSGVVFVGSDDGHLYALALADGDLRWSFDTGGPVEAGPLLLDDCVVVGSDDGILHARRRADGSAVWSYRTAGRIVGSANWAPSPAPHGSVLVGSYDNALHCVDAATGELRWKYETDNYVNGAVPVAAGRAVFGGCDGFVHVVAVDTGARVGRVELGAPIAGTVALDGRTAFIGHYGNQFVGIDLDTQAVSWTFAAGDFPFFSSAAVHGDFVVFGSRGKRVHAVDRAGRPRWSFSARGNVDCSPVICGDRVVVGSDDGRLYVLDLARGGERWSYQIGEAITASPAVAGGMIVIGAEDGVLYAFGPAGPATATERDDER